MRITGGTLRGRSFRVPLRIRPTQARIREAVFSVLQDRVYGACVLDLFAGSGALGLEAWSRGADSVCWVEGDRRVCQTLKNNIKTVCRSDGKTEYILKDVFEFLSKNRTRKSYDLIWADPPYGRGRHQELLQKILNALDNSPMIAPDAWFVFEQGQEAPVLIDMEWSVLKNKTYGDTRILFLKRSSVKTG